MGTHWRKLACGNSKFLTVWDIMDRTPLTVTIESASGCVYEGEDGAEGDKGLAVKFKGGKKPLGINATNGAILEKLHGPEIEGWTGKQVTLRTAAFKGEPCVRFDAPAGMKFGRHIPRFSYTDKIKAQAQEGAAV